MWVLFVFLVSALTSFIFCMLFKWQHGWVAAQKVIQFGMVFTQVLHDGVYITGYKINHQTFNSTVCHFFSLLAINTVLLNTNHTYLPDQMIEVCTLSAVLYTVAVFSGSRMNWCRCDFLQLFFLQLECWTGLHFCEVIVTLTLNYK